MDLEVHNGGSESNCSADGRQIVVALAGNPNVGKSTLFNSLTGLNQHTGNWPGKTVDLFYGIVPYQGKKYSLVDLPGTYSLRASSIEEQVARDFIVNERPDVTVCVVDATNLERNLNLVFQVRELTPNCVVCLNLIDEAALRGIHIDAARLEQELGLPVVPAVARDGTGLEQLMRTIAAVARKADISKAGELGENIEVAAESNGYTREGEEADSRQDVGDAEQQIHAVYQEASRIVSKAVCETARPRKDFTAILDDIVTSRRFGVPLMLVLLGVVLFITLYLSN